MRKQIILLSCMFLLVGGVFFLWVEEQNRAPMPEPSVWGGYYDEPFTLKLKVPKNGQIYYTTDGSLPTPQSLRYLDGIEIRDQSLEPNYYNAIRNVVMDWKNYVPDSTPVPKGTVIRALFVNEHGIGSEVLTQTYFVGIQPPGGYTLTLIFEEEDMFGENGIYVTGQKYDAWYLNECQSDISGLCAYVPPPEDENVGPNFLQDREIQVIAEAMDDTGEVFIQPVGLRIQGNSARGWDKKRLILVSREEYSGQKNFNGQFFPGIASHSVMLKKELPDSLVSELVADRAVATQSTVPVRVFFNGEFWYDSFLLERYDQQYFRQHYQVNDCTRVKDLEVEDHSDSQTEADYFSEYMFWVSNTDFSDEKQWLQLQKETDVQSYIDFICINYFLCNWDFSDDKNCIMWRSPRFEEVPCGDMRWRWCIYDVDALVWTQNHYEVDNPAELNIFSANLPYTDVKVKDTAHFRSLRSNPEFNRRFVLSFMDLLNNNFSLPNVQRVLEKYGESLDWMGGYFRKRPQYAVQHLAEEFGLTGTLEPVTIITQNPEMGSVVVNTSTVDLSSGYWCGEYFTDYPITITAAAKEGYRFVEWRGCTDTTSETITLAVDGGVSMEAVFEKKSR